MNTKSKSNLLISILGIVIVATFLALGFVLHVRSFMPKIDAQTYQLVQFDNGHQYYGHLNNLKTSYPYLEDVYFSSAGDVIATEDEISLVKSTEIMYLNWDKVLFWTNLSENSPLLQVMDQATPSTNNGE